MSEKSEAMASAITSSLEELVRIAEENDLPMLSYLLSMALAEAEANRRPKPATAPNIVRLPRR